MPVFFITPEQVKDHQVTISGSLLHHLRASLRLHVGERFWVGLQDGKRYLLRVTAVDRHTLVGEVLDVRTRPHHHTVSVMVAQALLKGDKMDWVVQKMTELGATGFLPLLTRHTVTRPPESRMTKQAARWQRIALESAQQAERWDVPIVHAPCVAEGFFSEPPTAAHCLILAEREGGQPLTTVPLPSDPQQPIYVTIGPEGGWSPDELDRARRGGFIPITLGNSILRAETAALAALSVLQSRLGNLG